MHKSIRKKLMRLNKTTVICVYIYFLFLLSVIFSIPTTTLSDSNNTITNIHEISLIRKNFSGYPYKPHGIIHISGNIDFSIQAANEKWNGSGTANDPYMISGYEIYGNGTSDGDLIYIYATTVYFILENLYIHNGNRGIVLASVKNANVTNVITADNYDVGIDLGSSSNNILTNNIAMNCTKFGGFMLSAGYNNTLINNQAYGNAVGFYSWVSNNNTFINNSMSNNIYAGISFRSSNGSFVQGNVIEHNPTGIRLDSGFVPPRTSNNNTMIENNISNNNIGISLSADTTGNIVKNNSFIENNKNAYDYNTNTSAMNIFMYNYWSDWISPDSDGNLIVDNPYSILGSAYNKDPYPVIPPNIADKSNSSATSQVSTTSGENTTTSNQTISSATPGWDAVLLIEALLIFGYISLTKYKHKKF